MFFVLSCTLNFGGRNEIVQRALKKNQLVVFDNVCYGCGFHGRALF